MHRRVKFVHAQLAWMLGALVILAALQALSPDLFFVISLIGFLIITELTAPFRVSPRWRARLKWIILLGLIVFAGIVIRRILAILPEGIL